MLFRHHIFIENGGKVTHEHHPVETRGVHTFEMTKFEMKNDDVLNNERARKVIMEHIRQNSNRNTELLACMISDDIEVINCVGLNRQFLDTFSNNMCHKFLSKHNDLFFESNSHIILMEIEPTFHHVIVILNFSSYCARFPNDRQFSK